MTTPLRTYPLLTLLLSLGLLTSGCPVDRDPFGDGQMGSGDDDTSPADDDDTGPDDDDTTPTDDPPVLEVTTPTPTDELLHQVQVDYQISDTDSDGYSVTVQVTGDYQGIGDTASTWAEATIINATNPPNVFAEDVGVTPFINHTGTLTWDSEVDFPIGTGNGALRFTPIDSDGIVGEMVVWPPDGGMVVGNALTEGLGGFCTQGHAEPINWFGGQALVPLSDGTCLNYQISDPPQPSDYSAQFLLVLVNPNEDDVGFKVSATDQPDAFQTQGVQLDQPTRLTPPTPRKASHSAPALPGGLGSIAQASGAGTCTPELTADDVNNDNRTFFFRRTIEGGFIEPVERETRGANLRALGQKIAVYVDDETPIDTRDCTTGELIEEQDFSGGFNNCDLEEVVDIFDNNIHPTITGLMGPEPDVDNNCRVTLLISHRVNNLRMTNGEEGDDQLVVRSFAEPQVDLWRTDLSANPNSNEQEILYAYAPDPFRFWSERTVPLQDYVEYQLAAEVARGFGTLVHYGNRVEVGKDLQDPTDPMALEKRPEDLWLMDAMATLSADLSGFGSGFYQDAWNFLDLSQAQPLKAFTTLEGSYNRGAQYLFGRYLYDLYGEGVVTDITQAQNTWGEDTVLAVTGAASFDEFALQWAVAMAVSQRQNDMNGQLVPDSVVPNYLPATINFNTDPVVPVMGEHHGAHGFQMGFNVRGRNDRFIDGADAGGPTPISPIRTANIDPMRLHPQADFFGGVAGDYGVVVIEVGGLEQAENYLLVETASGEDLLGAVIRINDVSPHSPTLTREDVDGPLITTRRDLGDLDPLGSERNVIGRIDEPGMLAYLPSPAPEGEGDAGGQTTGDDDDDDANEAAVPDVDVYTFTLTAETTLAAWAERRYSNINGEASLGEIYLAVSLADSVPNPSESPFCPPLDTEATYPILLPDFYAAQTVLSSSPYTTESWAMPDPESPPLGCGAPSAAFDVDQDGRLDQVELENMPATLTQQIWLYQRDRILFSGWDPTGYEVLEPYSTAMIDCDSYEPEGDTLPTSFPQYNAGGASVAEAGFFLGGEEAAWVGTLPAGEYAVVVGGRETVGPYDLSLRVVTDATGVVPGSLCQ